MGPEHPHRHHGPVSAVEVLDASSREGIRALQIGAAGLLATAVVQFAVVAVGGSVALLADALHNIGDVLTTIGLWIAFIATRRAANARYTFGYQRLEDLAGLGIVLAIFISGGLAIREAVLQIVRAETPSHLTIGIAAALVGVLGNEAVAQVKIRTGKRIHSSALVAEGQHSRVDALASLAVAIGLTGVALGLHWADPAVGLAIGVLILSIGVTAARPIIARLADRVDPAVIERIARTAASVEEVVGVHAIRARWAGRALYVILHIELPGGMRLEEAHDIGEDVRHRIFGALPQVVQVDVHIDPVEARPGEHHGTRNVDE